MDKQKYPKTINAIVEDLRERGDLDEEKWINYKDNRILMKYMGYSTILILLIIIITLNNLIITKLIYVFLILISSYFFVKQMSKDRQKYFLLYNLGKLTGAEVIKYEDGHTLGKLPVSKIIFSYYDKEKYENYDFLEKKI